MMMSATPNYATQECFAGLGHDFLIIKIEPNLIRSQFFEILLEMYQSLSYGHSQID